MVGTCNLWACYAESGFRMTDCIQTIVREAERRKAMTIRYELTDYESW